MTTVETERPRYDAFMATIHRIHVENGEPVASVWMTDDDRGILLREVLDLLGKEPKPDDPLYIMTLHGVKVGILEVLPPELRKTRERKNRGGTKDFTFTVHVDRRRHG